MKVWKFIATSLFLSSCSGSIDHTSNVEAIDIKEIVARQWEKVDFRKTEYFFHEKRIAHLKEVKKSQPNQTLIIDGLIGYEYLKNGDIEQAIALFTTVLDSLNKRGSMDHQLKMQILKKLGISYLRKAEQENCIDHHSYQSCILPFKNDGIHHFSGGSEKAIAVLEELLSLDDKDYTAIWLLNLAYMTIDQYPEQVPKEFLIPKKVFKSDLDFPRFEDVSARAGVDITGLSGGVCVDDFNNDGYLDIVASSWGIEDQVRFMLNNGDGSFIDQTDEAGLAGTFGGLNMIHADYDNDGFNDFLILRGAWFGEQGQIPNSLMRNKGDGTFEDVTISAGLLTYAATQTASWVDVNTDGWLDLFVGNEHTENELFINNQDGKFTNQIEKVSSTIDTKGYVKGCTFGDINNDGLADLYISYYNKENKLLLNHSNEDDIRFIDISKKSRASEPSISFPTWMWDYNNDGWLDIFVSGYGNNSGKSSATQVLASYFGHRTDAEPRLFKNNGNNTFSEVSKKAGLSSAFFTMGANYGDLNNDGWLDFYLGTGDPDYSSIYPNRMFLNQEGQTFADVTSSGGFGHIQKGHGVAFADFDNDGDQDVYQVMGGAHVGDVFQNILFENPGNENSWVVLKLKGTKSNRSAIGARVAIFTDIGEFHHVVSTGGSFGSASLQIEAGLGKSQSIHQVKVNWPNKEKSTTIIENLKINQTYLIVETADSAKLLGSKSFSFKKAKSHQH